VFLTVSEESERALLVHDLSAEAEDADISGVFENERIDGGPVEHIYHLTDTSALVLFEDKPGTVVEHSLKGKR